MASFSYNSNDFLPLPSKESSCQSISAYLSVMPHEQTSKAVSFCKTANPLLSEKNILVCTSKAYIFPLQSDDISKSDIRSPILSRKSFVCTIPGQLHACSSSVPPIAVLTCTNICNHSICCNSVSLSRSNVRSISKPAYPAVS